MLPLTFYQYYRVIVIKLSEADGTEMRRTVLCQVCICVVLIDCCALVKTTYMMFHYEGSVSYCDLMYVIALLGVIAIIYWVFTNSFSYWKDRGVPFIKPNYIFGSITNEILRKSSWNAYAKRCYETLKDNGFGGAFICRKPVFIVCDPHLIEKVTVQDFSYFHDRGYADFDEPLTKTLFNARGEKWRLMRHILCPSFTSHKIKGMLDQTLTCSDMILAKINESIHERRNTLEVDPLVFVYVVEIIASCVFGVQLLAEDKEAENFKKTVAVIYDTNPLRVIKFLFALILPKAFKLVRFSLIDESVTKFFVNLTNATIRYRLENNVVRSDFLQLMINLKEEGEQEHLPDIIDPFSEANVMLEDINLPGRSRSTALSKDTLITNDEIAALLFNFLTAGLKPSSGTISFALFELAKDATIQKKIQEEIDNTFRKHKQWSYEALKEMTYLDEVIQETLRMYCFNSFLVREVAKPYRVPGCTLILDKGMLVYVPVAGLHSDSQHYPSPDTFHPDRFKGNNYKPSPFFLPFGNGPRICIAIKFAVLTIKVCLAKVLFKYSVEVGSNMKLPLVLDQNEFYPKAKNGIWLTFIDRKH